MLTMTSRAQRGFTLIEVLIAVFVLGFGMLSLARLLARSSAGELEAVQRTQAMAIAQDAVDRINLNRRNAADYVGDYVPDGPVEDCADPALATQVLRDQCALRNLLRGATTYEGQKTIGAPFAARACITTTAANVYVIAIAWQGVVPTGAPDSACGQGAFDREANRRVYSTVVQIATLGT
jgi:type IV pilus assembly protein PilV